MAVIQFDATQHDPNATGGNRVIPPGRYQAEIVASEDKSTKDGQGKMLVLTVRINDGDEFGTDLTERLNLVNKSEKAQRIANNTLSAICYAVGILRPHDSEELHHRSMLIDVKVEETASVDKVTKQPQYNEDGTPKMFQSNVITKYYALDQAQQAPSQQQVIPFNRPPAQQPHQTAQQGLPPAHVAAAAQGAPRKPAPPWGAPRS